MESTLKFKKKEDFNRVQYIPQQLTMQQQQQLCYERRLKNAGILQLTKTTIDETRSKRLRKMTNKRSQTKSNESSSSSSLSASILNNTSNTNCHNDHYEEIGIGFLLELFSTDLFLSHDFVYTWSSKIRTRINSIISDDTCGISIKPDFETDLCCMLCFVFFSPFTIVSESTCLTLFYDVKFDLYFDMTKSYSILDSKYQYKEPEPIMRRNERERYERILKGCWKELYIEYTTLTPTCQAFLALWINKTSSIVNKVNETSRFRKFMFYAVLTEMVETFFFNIKQYYTNNQGHSSSSLNTSFLNALDEITSENIVISLIHFKNTFSSVLTLTQVHFFENLVPHQCKNLNQIIEHFEKVFYNDWTW